MDENDNITSLLGTFTVRDSIEVDRLTGEDLTAPDFFRKVLESKLNSKGVSSEAIHAWTDKFLLEVVLQWLIRSKIVTEVTGEPTTLENLHTVLVERVTKQKERFRAIVAPNQQELFRTAKHAQGAIRFLQPPNEQFRRSIATQFKSIEEAAKTLRLSGVTAAIPPNLIDKGTIASLLEAVRVRADELGIAQSRLNDLAFARSPLLEATRFSAQIALTSIAKQLGSVDIIAGEMASVRQISKMLTDQIQPIGASLRAAEMSMLSQTALSRMSLDRIGAVVGLQREYQQSLVARLAEVTSAYSHHIRSLGVTGVDIGGIRPLLIEPPAREIFITTEFVEIVSVDPIDDEASEERRKKRGELAVETGDALHDLLSELDPRFIVMLEGAAQALMSTNVDRVRHFTVSFRELFTQIIHTLAPDDEIRSWSNDPQHFNNKKPTRKARLLYICRGVNHPPLNDFFKKDIDAALELLDVFQGGTHRVENHLKIKQLVVLKLRMESAIRFILEVNKMNR